MRSYKLKDTDGFAKAVKASNARTRKGIKRGLAKIRKERNIGTVNSLNWDKRM